jgi:hypothetical protein
MIERLQLSFVCIILDILSLWAIFIGFGILECFYLPGLRDIKLMNAVPARSEN